MSEHADERHGTTGTTIKRRGILAAAGAVVAALVAKQASEPVAALDPNDLALGTSNTSGAQTDLEYTGGVLTQGTLPNAVLLIDDGHLSNSKLINTNITAILAASAGGGKARFGVYGEGGFAGVCGMSYTTAGYSSAIGVYGGIAYGGGEFAVVGDGNNFFGAFSIGVRGQSPSGVGVEGISDNGFPIIGSVQGASNTSAGVLGTGTAGPGVQGQSPSGHGLVGTTDATDGHAGLIGNATHTGGIGLMGIAPNYGSASVGLAGDFYGNVKINGGTLSAPVMQATVQHAADGSYRALPGVLSPESWVEDFGEGTLAGGKATITLDPDFAALVHTDTYHVFLTAHTPQQLHVPTRTAGGFSVVATATGTVGAGLPPPDVAAGTFSWRVVAKRKDVSGARLAKVNAPGAPKTPAAITRPVTPVVKPPAGMPPPAKP